MCTATRLILFAMASTANSAAAGGDLLQKILDRFAETDRNTSNGFTALNSTLETLTNKVQTVQEDQRKTAEEVSELQEEVGQVREEVVAVDQKIDKVDDRVQKLEEKTEDRFKLLESQLSARVVSLPVHVPSLSVGEQCSVQAKFELLLDHAKASSNIFAAGHVKDKTPAFGVKRMIERYFSKVDARVLPKLGVTKVWRFAVDESKVGQVKAIINTQIMAIRDHGWWVQQDVPLQLRKMYSNCFNFFKRARDLHVELRRWYLNVDDGYVLLDSTPVVPVYLVPKCTDNWPEIAGLLNELVAEVSESEWFESAKAPLKVPEGFLAKWCEALGVESPGNPESTLTEATLSSNGVSDEQDDDMSGGGGG